MKKFGWMGLAMGLVWMVAGSEADAGHRHRAGRGGNSRHASVENYQASDSCCNSGYSGYSSAQPVHNYGYASPAQSGSYSNSVPIRSGYNGAGYATSSQSSCGCGSTTGAGYANQTGTTGYAPQTQSGMYMSPLSSNPSMPSQSMSSQSGVNTQIPVPTAN